MMGSRDKQRAGMVAYLIGISSLSVPSRCLT
jgi:hypothetical protein